MKTLPLLLVLACPAVAPAASSAVSAPNPPAAAVVGLPAGEPSVICEWNAALCEWLEKYPDHASLHAQARMFAIVHLAMRDAIKGVGAPAGQPAKQAQASLAALTAAREVVESAATLDEKRFSVLHDRLRAAIPSDAEATRAIKLGQQAGAAILHRRRTDGWPFLVAGGPAAEEVAVSLLRRPIETSTRAITESGWTKLAPFGLKRVDQFEPEPPYFRYGDELVLPNDRLQKRNRIGAPGQFLAGVPAYHAWRMSSIVRWNRAARSLAAQHPATLADQARVFAALNAALADALLAGSYWCERYESGRANPTFTTIAQEEAFNRAFEAGQLPMHPDMHRRAGQPMTGFPALTAVIAGAAESVLAAHFGGGEAVLQIDPAEPPTTLHDAARECAWAMASNGTTGTVGCVSGHDFGFRIGEYIRKQTMR
jgi:hypothetical protein